MSNKLEETFHKYPEYTDLPLFESGDHRWVCLGHPDTQELINEIAKVQFFLTEDAEASVDMFNYKENITQGYAYLASGDTITKFELVPCEKDHTGAFPVSVLCY